jgi:aspartate/methionine/tyrosine aminotransferase
VRIADFALERYFARWEFAVEHVLCASDVEGLPMSELLALADPESAALWANLRLGYTESTGHPLLRAEIARLYDQIEPDDVLVFSGAEEAIFCLLNVLFEPGDHGLVTWPGYQSLHEVARAAGARVGLHALIEQQGWALDADRLLRSLHPNTRAVVVNAPHNPTGMLPERDEWAGLAAELEARGVRLVADEVYRFLEVAPAETLAGGADLAPRHVSIGVLSKSFALAGLRIGWLASRDRELLARCAAFKDYTTICASAPSEILGIIALRARETILARSREIVAGNLARLDALIAERADTFAWVRPRGGSTGYMRLLPGGPAGGSAERFCAALVEATGVLLLPGTTFGAGDDHVRVGLGRTDLPDAVAKLESFLDRRSG